jgi:hypothetical protein
MSGYMILSLQQILDRFADLRQAPLGGSRAPHKPLFGIEPPDWTQMLEPGMDLPLFAGAQAEMDGDEEEAEE